MGLFDSIRRAFTTPSAITDALSQQGMDSSANLGPGAPLQPNNGYSVSPRAMDYPVAVNTTVRNRKAWGRVEYAVLRELLRSYDVATAAMNHKIDELRSMEPMFIPAEGFTGDADEAVDAARAVFAFPDREHPWDEWLGMWLTSILTFDAGPLYIRRNYNGDIIGLEVLDGSTIYPYVDENGRRPRPPAPAYYQVIKGQNSVDYTAQDIVFTRFRPQDDSPFGMAPLESILTATNTDIRFQWHLLQMFTEGSIPGGFMEVPPDVSSPDQVAEWQDYWDATFMGDQSIVHKLVAVPNGAKFTETAPRAFDPNFPDYLARKVCAAFGVVPQDLGYLNDVNRATADTQTDTQFRVNTLPWVRFVEAHMTRHLKRLGLPVEFKLNTGREKEDRLQDIQAWKLAAEAGFVSLDEGREELFGLPTDNVRPIPRGLILPRQGFVPLDSILAISGKIDPETKAPTPDAALPYPFDGTPGLMPDKLPGSPAFHRAEQNPDDPQNPETQKPVPGSGVVQAPVEAEKDAAPAAGMTSATGLTGVDQLGRDDEMRKFATFSKARERAGKWRDFDFKHIPADEAKALNADARARVVKADPKGWRADPEQPTPFHRVDLTLTDYWGPVFAAALAGAVDADTLAEDALDEGWTAAEAADYAGDVFAPAAVSAALQGMRADGFLAGALSAGEQNGAGDLLAGFNPGIGIEFRVPDEVPEPVIDALSGTAWQQAISDAGVTLKGITDTTLARMGALIERAVEAGHTVDRLAADLDAYLSDPSRAEMVAHTEIARMATNASLRVYRAYGVTQWDLVVSAGACPTCLDAASRNPHDASDTSDMPPLHPRCRCAASPHVEGP